MPIYATLIMSRKKRPGSHQSRAVSFSRLHPEQFPQPSVTFGNKTSRINVLKPNIRFNKIPVSPLYIRSSAENRQKAVDAPFKSDSVKGTLAA